MSSLVSPALVVERLIIFARIPEPGAVKTRLIPVLGPEGAARLHQDLAAKTFQTAWQLRRTNHVAIDVWYSGGDERQAHFLTRDLDCQTFPQRGRDLGERLQQATTDAYTQHAQRVVIVGTDCPDLSPHVLQKAFSALQHSEVVLGPAHDGGYYLIGLSRNLPEMFDGIDWGSERVLEQTMTICRRLGLNTTLLEALPDVDLAEDLIACRRFDPWFRPLLPACQPGRLSVVIPTLNEEAVLKQTLESLGRDDSIEVIVADGGSTDATVDIARQWGAMVVQANRGRGRQMNAGAAFASGDILLFLHADSRLPTDFHLIARRLLASDYLAGAFRLRIDAPRRSLRLIEWAANARSRLFETPYGDQALFVRATSFFAIGGFPNWPLMEEYEFCRRLRHFGRIGLAEESVITSARRWMALGVFRTTLMNQLTILGFHLGVSPQRLARWYSGWKKRRTG